MHKLYISIPVIIIFFLSVGFSAFENTLLVDGVDVVVRPEKNIRVTNVENPYGENSGLSKEIDYNVDNINGKINLPNSNSTVKYKITVTNIGNIDMGILSTVATVNGDDSVLQATISPSDYVEGTKLCNTSNVCSGGISKSFDVTISYKSGATVTSNDIEFIVTFDFRQYYTITYNGFTSTTGLDTGILAGATKNIVFGSANPIPSVVNVTGASGTLSNSTLTLSNATGNVTVTRNYTITYSGFTGDTGGLVSSLPVSGGTITFDATSSIPSSVTVSGATGTYTNSTLVISNVTGDITITASYASAVTLAYESIQNVYSNPPTSRGTCTYTILPDDSDDENLRYVGADPCNYIYFNNSNWRIVGIFNVDGEKLIKIVNPTAYSSSDRFHTSSTSGYQYWTKNSLSNTLNSTFYQTLVTNGYGDFIKSVYWNVGSPGSNVSTPKTFYNAEAGTVSESSVNIGLLNISDILYATSGPTNGDRTTSCLNVTVYGYGSSTWSRTGCISSSKIVNDWLFSGNNEWTIDALSNAYVFRMQSNGIPYQQSITGTTNSTRTVVYLKENIKIDSGDGSSNLPYRISLVQ